MNWIYVWGHWPVLAITAIWLFMRHRREFSLFRNALIISGLLGLIVFALFPVMPPRLLGIGMVDTVAQWSSSHQILQPPSLVNQYAAVPSFHVGWNVLVAVAIFRARPKWDLRVVAIILPIAMIASVVLTGNHYLLDAVAGIAVVAVAWIIGERIERRRPVRT
jgi:membrane-associated phospholipid phosphatase